MGTGVAMKAIRLAITEAHRLYGPLQEGNNASYIPALAEVSPQLFGIVAANAEGETAEVGDSQQVFAIESISKVFTLANVLDEIGAEELRSKIGSNPTGESFSSVQALLLHGGRPLNPFVNAGAIATVSLVAAPSPQGRWEKIAATMEAFAGRRLEVLEDIYRSESETNQHNRAIAWLMESAHAMYSDPMESTDVYTRQCSVGITCRDLALMGATLAARGVNPITKRRAVRAENVPKILAEMAMNGLYDNTGGWAYDVGLPGKSGVGGGLLAVVPGRIAIATFSPPLDRFGNSVRGQRAIRHVTEALRLNLLDPP